MLGWFIRASAEPLAPSVCVRLGSASVSCYAALLVTLWYLRPMTGLVILPRSASLLPRTPARISFLRLDLNGPLPLPLLTRRLGANSHSTNASILPRTARFGSPAWETTRQVHSSSFAFKTRGSTPEHVEGLGDTPEAKAAAAIRQRGGKTIVLCLDGTGDEYDDDEVSCKCSRESATLLTWDIWMLSNG